MFRSILLRRRALFAVFSIFFLASIISKAAMATVYTTESSFTSQLDLSNNYHEDYSTFTPGAYPPPSGSTSAPFSSSGTPTFNFTLSTVGGGSGNVLFVLTPGGNYPSGRAISTTVNSADLLITFTSGNVTAVGANFSLTTIGESQAPGTFDITLSDGTVETITTPSGTYSLPFRGFTTDAGNPITSLLFHQTAGAAQFVTLDNLYVGQVTPVPESPFTGIAAGLLCFLAGGGVVAREMRSKLRSQIS